MRGATAGLISALVAAAWIGASLLTATVVAPAAFAVLPQRALAGALVGRVLPVLFVAGMLVGVAIAAVAQLPAGFGRGRLVAGFVAAAACAAAQFLVAPRIQAVRVAIGPSLEALAIGDPRRMEFGRLHGVSVLCLGVAILAVTAAVAMTGLALRPPLGARS